MSDSTSAIDPSISLEEVLEFSALREASPEILTLPGLLSQTQVRWAHVCEQADMTEFVDEGHLVLTSGVGLGPGLDGWRQIIESLGRRGSSGLIVELRVTLDEIPRELIECAERANLALIALRKPSRFVDITQSVHRAIADRQHAELQRTAHVHKTFTRLMTQNATTQEIVRVAGNFVSVPTVLEDNHHRVLAFHDDSASSLLDRWGIVGRSVPGATHPQALALPVMIGGNLTARLVMVFTQPPGVVDVMVAERAVAAIALTHSREVEDRAIRDGAQAQLLGEMMQPGSVDADLISRLQAFGLPVSGRCFFAALIRVPEGAVSSADLSSILDQALRGVGVEGVAASFSVGLCHLLVSVPIERDESQVLPALSSELNLRLEGSQISFSELLNDVREVPGGFSQAQLALTEAAFSPHRPYYRPRQMSGYGVLALLDENPHLQRFVEHQLSPVLSLSDRERDQHIETLFVFLGNGQNVSLAAKKLFISRPALYARLRKLSDLLHVDLSEPGEAFSISLAVTAYQCWQRVQAS